MSGIEILILGMGLTFENSGQTSFGGIGRALPRHNVMETRKMQDEEPSLTLR